MRRFLALVLAAGLPISLGYAIACGPPSSFENLTGGVKADAASAETSVPLTEDPTLPPPRPMAPLASSWVNGSRPHFRWELAEKGGTGARVVVCPDKACTDPGKKREWTVTDGRELQAAEDLPPGRYFWHLVSTNATSFGTQASPTWSLLVRGGAGDGWAAGNLNDLNADGIADLFITVEYSGGLPSNYHDAVAFLGSKTDDPLALVTGPDTGPFSPRDYQIGTTERLAIQSVDLDGDGINDPIFADVQGLSPGRSSVFAFRGSATKADLGFELGEPMLPGLDLIPQIAAPGDLDGDGRGDILVGTKTFTLAIFGGSEGLNQFSFLSQISPNVDVDAGELPAPATPQAVNGADLDNDGHVDVAVPLFFTGGGLFFVQSKGDARSIQPAMFGVRPSADFATPATASAFGDVDGDGTNDIAFVSTKDGKGTVCISARASDGTSACWSPATPPAGFASSLAAADVDGDGKDEILVGSSAGGVDVLRLTAPDKIEAEHLTVDYGATMTVIDPGRPKAAVWAATRADGTSVALFQGKEQKRVLTLKDADFIPGSPAVRYWAAIR